MEHENFNNNDFNELDDLRQQINALKNKVNEHGHLNEGLVKKTIQGKMRGVHRTLMLLGVAALFCIPLFIWMKFDQNLSWALTIFTIVVMLGSLVSDYFINRIDVQHMGDDLVETARQLTQMKKNRSLAQRCEIGIVLTWLLWFMYELYHSNLANGVAAAWGSIIPLIVGAILGTIVGISIYLKMQRANDEIINHINELTREV